LLFGYSAIRNYYLSDESLKKEKMSKNEQLIELFNKQFIEDGSKKWNTKNQEEKKECVFGCDKRANCNVDEGDGNPKYTGWLGDEKSEYMLVSESPSAAESDGSYFSGSFENFFNGANNSSAFKNLYDFFKDELNTIPYFTDLAKCGAKDTKNKKEIRKRFPVCWEKFLFKEIEICDPKIIVCVGTEAYKFLSGKKDNGNDKDKALLGPVNLVKLLHFSRQAGLSLTDDDKKIIWELQLLEKKEVSIKKLVKMIEEKIKDQSF